MLLDFPIHYTFLPCRLLDSWEEVDFFEMMMRFNKPMPSQTIPYEILVVAVSNFWSLLVDAIVASNQGVMTECHV